MDYDFDKDYWEQHYQKVGEKSSQSTASPHLIDAVSELAPGLALDAGCGVGADAVWLARKGWSVTAVDISSVVLEKAKSFAEALGVSVNFECADLTSWLPEKNQYDLVTSQYVHTTNNRSFIKKLGEAVKPGGTLLVVGHQPSNGREADHHARGSHITVGEIASYLSSDEWAIEVAEPRTIAKMTQNGKPVPLNDSVLRACKRSVG